MVSPVRFWPSAPPPSGETSRPSATEGLRRDGWGFDRNSAVEVVKVDDRRRVRHAGVLAAARTAPVRSRSGLEDRGHRPGPGRAARGPAGEGLRVRRGWNRPGRFRPPDRGAGVRDSLPDRPALRPGRPKPVTTPRSRPSGGLSRSAAPRSSSCSKRSALKAGPKSGRASSRRSAAIHVSG